MAVEDMDSFSGFKISSLSGVNTIDMDFRKGSGVMSTVYITRTRINICRMT